MGSPASPSPAGAGGAPPPGVRLRASLFGNCAADTNADSKAAWDVYRGSPPSAWHDRSKTDRVQRIYRQSRAMRGSNPPLKKHVVVSGGIRRDFDFNLEGLAHYGLLPDMLQDLRNVGLTAADLAPLFRGAEDFARMWEATTRRSPEIRRAIR